MLTVLRLAAAPGVLLAFLLLPRPWADWTALVLFVGTAATDWVDGYLARAWGMESRMGAMLDPIADKALVVIALVAVCGFNGMTAWLVLPATFILFREVFVSGLREYLGARAGTLKVTPLAKWKTFAQMVAIAVLFAQGLFEHYVLTMSYALGEAMMTDILSGRAEDTVGLAWRVEAMVWSFNIGVALFWIAALLTAITGWDYWRKARPHLTEPEET